MTDLVKDKVAIVTGAGRGIGRGVAKLLASEGASVVVVDPGVNVDGSGSDTSPAQQVVREITDAGGTAVASLESVTTMQGGENIVNTAIDSFGKLDIVVTCAGILRDRMVFNMTEQEWDDVISVHLKGTFTVVKHACILFRQQRSGESSPSAQPPASTGTPARPTMGLPRTASPDSPGSWPVTWAGTVQPPTPSPPARRRE